MPPAPDDRAEHVARQQGLQAGVEVVYALPDKQRVVRVPLPACGLTAAEALDRSGLLHEFPEIAARPLVLGIYGVACEPSRPLGDGDRVEVYRPLVHDPRALRRERAAGTGNRKGRKK
jgi:hypothetical protein